MLINRTGGGGKPEEEKTVTAGTSTKVVTPSEGKTIKKVTINPTSSQSKSVTPNESAQTVSPDSGKLLSSVSIDAIKTETKTVTAGTEQTTVVPSSGKYIKKVTVNPTPTESKSVTPTTSELTVTPSEGKHLSQVVVGAVEDVTPEVTAQTPVITQIAENLGVTITTPSGTNKQILQGNNANLLDIKNNAKKEGLYVWKKLTADGGDFVDFVVSDSETSYPDGGTQGGYWYEKVVEGIAPKMFGCTKFAVDKFTVSYNSSSFNMSHSLSQIPKFAILLASQKHNSDSSSYQLAYKVMFISTGSKAGQVAITVDRSGTEYIQSYADTSTGKHDTISNTTIRFNGDGYSYFTVIHGGYEYTLITMA